MRAFIPAICLAALVWAAASGATAAEEANSFSYETEGETVTITQAVYRDDPVIIPETIDGKPVIRIGPNAFANLGVKDVSIPGGQGTFPSQIQGYPTLLIASDKDMHSISAKARIWLILLIVLSSLIVLISIPILYFTLQKNKQAVRSYRRLLAWMIAGMLIYSLIGLLRHTLQFLPEWSGFQWWLILGFIFIFILQAIPGSLVFTRMTRRLLRRTSVMRACLTGFPVGFIAAALVIALPVIILFMFTGLAVSVPWWITALYEMIVLAFGAIAGVGTGLMAGRQLGLKKSRRMLALASGLAGLLAASIIRGIAWTQVLLQDGQGSSTDLYLSWSIMDLFLGCCLGLAIALAAREAEMASVNPETKPQPQPSIPGSWQHP